MATVDDERRSDLRGDLSFPPQAYSDALTVRSYEVGRDGAVRPGTILRYLEHLATRASAALGFDNRWYGERGGAWVVREMSLLLGERPTLDDALRLATWVADFRRVQAIRDYLITNARTGRMVARASARWAYIDRIRLAPQRVPEDMQALMGPWGRQMRPRRIDPAPSAPVAAARMPLVAREYEADTQQHINNCVYLDWFDEAAALAQTSGALLPTIGPAATTLPRFYRLEYIRAAVPGDVLVVQTAAPSRTRSRSAGFWQWITTADGADKPIARAWAERLIASPGRGPRTPSIG